MEIGLENNTSLMVGSATQQGVDLSSEYQVNLFSTPFVTKCLAPNLIIQCIHEVHYLASDVSICFVLLLF